MGRMLLGSRGDLLSFRGRPGTGILSAFTGKGFHGQRVIYDEHMVDRVKHTFRTSRCIFPERSIMHM
jgi:hypothetical protein